MPIATLLVVAVEPFSVIVTDVVLVPPVGAARSLQASNWRKASISRPLRASFLRPLSMILRTSCLARAVSLPV